MGLWVGRAGERRSQPRAPWGLDASENPRIEPRMSKVRSVDAPGSRAEICALRLLCVQHALAPASKVRVVNHLQQSTAF